MSERENDWRKTIPEVIKEVLPKWRTISKEMVILFTKEVILTSKGEQKRKLKTFLESIEPVHNLTRKTTRKTKKESLTGKVVNKNQTLREPETYDKKRKPHKNNKDIENVKKCNQSSKLIIKYNHKDIEKSLHIVYEIAHNFSSNFSHTLEYDELVSEGYFGLIFAMKEFDSKKRNNFKSIAEFHIKKEIIKAILSKGNYLYSGVSIKSRDISESLKLNIEKKKDLKTFEQRFFKKDMKNLFLYDEDIIQFLSVLIKFQKSHKQVLVEDSNFDEYLIKKEMIFLMNQILESLNEQQRKVILWRFGFYNGEELTLSVIGKKLNLSRERIRQIEEEGLKQLRKNISRDKRNKEFLKGFIV